MNNVMKMMMKMRMMMEIMMMVNCCDDDIARPAGPPPPQSAVKWHSGLEKKARADGKVLYSIKARLIWLMSFAQIILS